MIFVVIPSFKSKDLILPVLEKIGSEVDKILVVDDACPLQTGKYVEQNCADKRVIVLYHQQNQGVGGACVTGFQYALENGAEVVVKIDSDGQMDPTLIPLFIEPILTGSADYSKGNRFYYLDFLKGMSAVRIAGNAGLSFFNKLSSGYWDIMDPTNGYVAIHAKVLKRLPLEKLDKRFFFESDLLFRLNILRAKIQDIPAKAIYGDETSNLSVTKSLFIFPGAHLKRFIKRIGYSYFLRDFNVASVNLVLGSIISSVALTNGLITYSGNLSRGVETPTGTIMIIMMSIFIGFELLLSFINYDTTHTPKTAIHHSL